MLIDIRLTFISELLSQGLLRMKTYNGFKNYSYWNVSLWINNDQGLYNLALQSLNATKNTKAATNYLLFILADNNKTLDNVKFNASNVYPVLLDIKKGSI